MILSDTLMVVVSVIAVIWAIYQIYSTHQLDVKLTFLTKQLDQSVQRLHRARDAAIRMHEANVFLIQYVSTNPQITDVYCQKHAELSASRAELRGLAFAIDDKELLDIVNENLGDTEGSIRNHVQRIHTRISKLIEITSNNSQ
jgi:hypothetical protein